MDDKKNILDIASRFASIPIRKIDDVWENRSTFICPHCGGEFSVSEAIVVDETTDTKSAGSTIRGRTVIHKFIDTHHRVRFCPKCAKRRETVRKWAAILIWYIAPIALAVFFFIRGWNDIDNILLSIFASLLMAYLTTVIFILIPVGGILNLVYFKIDVEKAAKDNALLSIWDKE